MRISRIIAEAATKVVETDAGLWFKIKRISSADLILKGFAGLALLPSALDQRRAESPDEAVDPMTMLRENPQAMVDLGRHAQAVACAGVTHVSADQGATWEPLSLVLVEADADEDNGVSWVGSLPPELVSRVFGEIMAAATDGGRLAKAIATFRASPDVAARG